MTVAQQNFIYSLQHGKEYAKAIITITAIVGKDSHKVWRKLSFPFGFRFGKAYDYDYNSTMRMFVFPCLALCVAMVSCSEESNSVTKDDDSKQVEKRGLHSFGDYGHGGHHEHIKTVTIEKKVPVPYTVTKHVPYTVEKKVPYEVKVPVPEPYYVEKKVPVHVKEYVKVPVHVPKPYEVIKKVPYEVKYPVDKPYEVKVSVPQPYEVIKKIPYEVKVPVPQPYEVIKKIPYEVKVEIPVPKPYEVIKKVPYEVKVPVEKPYPVEVPKPYPVEIEKPYPVVVEKKVPYEVKYPVDKPYKVEVEKPYPVHVKVPVPQPYTVEKKVPYTVEKAVPYEVKVPIEKPYPVYSEVKVPLHKEIPIPEKYHEKKKLEVLDRETGIMLDELTYEVRQLFPEDKIPVSLMTTIYLSAKLNYPLQLAAAMNEIPNPDLRNYVMNMKFDEVDGQSLTPLTMAAIAGNISYVKTLLAQYDIDMEKECNVVFDGLVVYGATALWVASGLGHLQVVKLLVQNGADVNHNTKAQSSPLRAACYAGRLDIVKYLIEHGADINLGNKYNNTCIMIAAYKGHEHVVYTLLKNGANPNDQALCGATALHYAAECGHLEVCRLLLDHGARLLANEHGLTPVLCAAERTHEQLVDFFIERPDLMNKDEIINALELLGASSANDKDNYSIEKAFQHLMRAMELRYAEQDRTLRKQCIPPVTAYDEWFETQNIQELQAIRLNHHSIHMEALTIRERILGRNNPDLPQPIVYRGAVMADHGRFAQCQVLWNYAMDLRIMTNVSVERDLLRFAQLFSQILRLENENLNLDQVLSVLVKCQQEIERNNEKINNPGPKDVPQMIADHNEQNITTALYLIKIITKILPKQVQISKSQVDLLYSTIKKFIKSDTRMSDGQTLSH
uniref:Uncharacterized protein n=1 Tax=Glossina morsitans morsitans TaxID=37546 RepID=A0A1B0F9D1_GLOMM